MWGGDWFVGSVTDSRIGSLGSSALYRRIGRKAGGFCHLLLLYFYFSLYLSWHMRGASSQNIYSLGWVTRAGGQDRRIFFPSTTGCFSHLFLLLSSLADINRPHVILYSLFCIQPDRQLLTVALETLGRIFISLQYQSCFHLSAV